MLVLPCPIIHRVKVGDWFWKWEQSGERRSGSCSPQPSWILVSVAMSKEEISPCLKAWLWLTPHPKQTSDYVYVSNLTGYLVYQATLDQQWCCQLPMTSSMYKRYEQSYLYRRSSYYDTFRHLLCTQAEQNGRCVSTECLSDITSPSSV